MRGILLLDGRVKIIRTIAKSRKPYTEIFLLGLPIRKPHIPRQHPEPFWNPTRQPHPNFSPGRAKKQSAGATTPAYPHPAFGPDLHQ